MFKPEVHYTHTDSGLIVSFDFNCVANPRMLESHITHLFYILNLFLSTQFFGREFKFVYVVICVISCFLFIPRPGHNRYMIANHPT